MTILRGRLGLVLSGMVLFAAATAVIAVAVIKADRPSAFAPPPSLQGEAAQLPPGSGLPGAPDAIAVTWDDGTNTKLNAGLNSILEVAGLRRVGAGNGLVLLVAPGLNAGERCDVLLEPATGGLTVGCGPAAAPSVMTVDVNGERLGFVFEPTGKGSAELRGGPSGKSAQGRALTPTPAPAAQAHSATATHAWQQGRPYAIREPAQADSAVVINDGLGGVREFPMGPLP